jgi:hypothetical protein
MWSRSFAGTTHDAELAHAANKRYCGHLSKWSCVAARAVNGSVKHQLSAAFLLGKHKSCNAVATSPSKPALLHKGRLAPSKSGLQLFHRSGSKRDSRLGKLHVSPMTKSYWAAVKEEWSQLSEEDTTTAGHHRDHVSSLGVANSRGCVDVCFPIHIAVQQWLLLVSITTFASVLHSIRVPLY